MNNTPQTRMPGIVSVLKINPAMLPCDIEAKAIAGIKVALNGVGEPVSMSGMGRLTVADDPKNGGAHRTATLTFTSGDRMDPAQPTAFAATDASGRTWLIGGDTCPWPRIASTDSAGSADEAAVITYEVTLTSRCPMAECS